jgi:chromosome segregation ATPase
MNWTVCERNSDMQRSLLYASLVAMSFSAAVPALAQSSCRTYDPRQGGFFGGLCNLSNGNYDRRLKSRQDELSVLDKTKADLEKKLASRKVEVESLETRIAETRRRAETRRAAVASVDVEIALLRERSSVTKAELAILEADNEVLSQDLVTHMSQARRTEVAVRAIQDGALAAVDRREIQESEARNREEGERLDRKISDIRRRLSRAGKIDANTKE